MSADLLRRAAKVLREHAENATPGPWIAAEQTSDGQNFVGTVVKGTGPAVSIEVGSHDGNWTLDLDRQTADATYLALMHPPVALALAHWLDAEAESASRFELDTGLSGAVVLEATGAVRVARAILREASDG